MRSIATRRLLPRRPPDPTASAANTGTHTFKRKGLTTLNAEANRLARLNVNMNRPTSEALRELADRRGLTNTEIVRQAIGTLKYLDDAASRGGRVQVLEPDGRVFELVQSLY